MFDKESGSQMKDVAWSQRFRRLALGSELCRKSANISEGLEGALEKESCRIV